MGSIALIVSLLWATCSAIPTASSRLFEYENDYLTDDLAASSAPIKNNTCKVFPGDADWPSPQVWGRFNQTLNGALIQTVPLAAPCYPDRPEYNPERCNTITNRWTNSTLHANDPTSIMWPVYEGSTCLPSDGGNTTCTLGGYPSYVVNASTVAHIQLAVKFARENGIRLVVKNSGHDYLGKSAGAGALSIWTHRLNDMQYLEDYQSKRYRGNALKMGAGVAAEELYRMAKKVGFTPVSVGGEGHTVGIAGGYLLGGGHSPLSSKHGLSVDQVLCLQVVLANGTFVTVTEETDSDLFWALRGSGGSTYGIVTSVISAVYPPTGVTLCTFTFSTGPNITVDTFWNGFRAYLDYFPEHADAGIYSYFTLLPEANNKYSFLMNPFFAPGHTQAEVNALLRPWFAQLDHLGIRLQNLTIKSYDNIYNAWTDSVARQLVGKADRASGSRLFPRSNWADKTSLDSTFNALRETVSAGYRIVAYNMKFTPPAFTAPNAANPAFRSSLMFAITGTFWDPATISATDVLAQIRNFAGPVLDVWRRVSPGSGAYLSEAVVLEPDFQSSFFGAGPDNYGRLLALKKRFDPHDVFYALCAVGSEEWELQSRTAVGFPDQNGRLCRKKQ